MIWNAVQKLCSYPSISRCLLECECANETGDAIWTRGDCGTPLPGAVGVEGDFVKEMISGSG